MSLEEILELIDASIEIHIRSNSEILGMIPSVRKNNQYTRKTKDWIENRFVYSDQLFPEVLDKAYSDTLFKREVINISVADGGCIILYLK